MEKKVFLTGSTGFIGQQLSTKLLSMGYQLNLLVRDLPKSNFNHNPNVNLFCADLLNEDMIQKAMDGCDKVYHLAGCARIWVPDYKEFYDTNVIGTINVLKSAEKLGIEKVVVTSSCAVLGPSLSQPVSETTRREVPFFNNYDKSKHLMEKEVLHYARRGLNVLIVSPPRVYGPGLEGESNTLIDLVKKYLVGSWKFIPQKDRIGSYAYIDDVVNGHILAMEKGLSGEKYILGGDNRNFSEVFTIIRQLTGVNYPLYKVPVRLILFGSLIESFLCKITGTKPNLPYDWSSKLTFDWAVSSDKAINELGYTSTSLEKGLQQTLRWMLESEKRSGHLGLFRKLDTYLAQKIFDEEIKSA